jgi:hypothetical protein
MHGVFRHARRLLAAGAVLAIPAIGLTAGPAMASTHPRPNTIGCTVNPFCFDIANAQLGPGDVLTVGGTGAAGSPIKLKAHNGQNPRQDNLIVPVGTVQSTLNGDTTDYPFNNPFVDQFLQNVGDTLVFSSQYAPNGHIKQLVAGLSTTNKLVLQQPGVFGSQQYQNGLWVAVPFPQINGQTPLINVGQTNATGTYMVLTMHNGATAATQPFVKAGTPDSLGQFGENQGWFPVPNYP